MGFLVNNLSVSIFAFLLGLGLSSASFGLDLSPDDVGEIIKISKNIELAKPNLADSKKLEYAVGIFKAARQFDISSNLLIAIAAQETSFREDLPEGNAGEFGIVQIRKNWMLNKKFRKSFKNAKTKDLLNPEKAFLYAAWILRDLKDNSPKGAIPYWSYYNARGFQPRFRYFLSVNQKLSYLNKGLPFAKDVADNVQINRSAERKNWQSDVRLLAETPQVAVEIPSAKGYSAAHSKENLITTASLGSGISVSTKDWIKQAQARFKKEQNKAAENDLPKILTKTGKSRQSRKLAFSRSAARLLKSIPE